MLVISVKMNMSSHVRTSSLVTRTHHLDKVTTKLDIRSASGGLSLAYAAHYQRCILAD
jgi:hypothetical protein